MSKSITPTYRIVIDETLPMVWRGPVSQDKLDAYIKAYAKSLELNGVNEHISLRLGFIPYPTKAEVIHQKTGAIVASWHAAPFQVW